MRATILSALFVTLTGALATAATEDDKKDEKIDPAKLVGKWEVKDQDGVQLSAEFTKDGVVRLSHKIPGGTLDVEGTYKLDGVKLTIVSKSGGNEREETLTIRKLTDTELVVTEGEKRKVEFTRVKDKK